MGDHGGPVELMGSEQDGGASGHGVLHERIDEVTTFLVEGGVGLVEQPELRSPGEQHGQRGSPPLPRRQPGHGHVGQTTVETEASHGGLHVGATGAAGPGPERDVVGHREVVVETAGVTQQAHPVPDGPRIGSQIDPEDRRLAVDHGDQAGAGAQHRGLAGTVGPLDQHDLTWLDVEIDTGQRWKAAQEAHGTTEADSGFHGLPKRYRGATRTTEPGPEPPGATPGLAIAAGILSPVLATTLRVVGRTLVTAGVLILLFVAYQLWGTNLQQAKAQDSLKREFAETLSTAPSSTTTSTTPPTTTPGAPVSVVPASTLPADLPLPKYGEPIAELRIPRIGLRTTVVEGADLTQLKRGPAHYQETPLPGQKGNAAIAGHRTTYGAPFHNVDKLQKGDQLIVKTLQGEFVYEVDTIEIVKPSDVHVLDDKGDNRLTLTACHPKYSAKERIIISGVMKGSPAPEIDGQAEARDHAAEIPGDQPTTRANIDGDLSGIAHSRTPAIVWGFVCAGIWLATWLVSRFLRRNAGRRARFGWVYAWSPYLIGVPIFLVALYVFFENFALLLPANF